MRIVITGASGNIGTALLLRLRDTGEHELVGVTRRPPPQAAPYTWAQWHHLDIGHADAADRLTEIFRGADAVVHLAWRLQARAPGRPEMERTNHGGTRAVAEAARRAGVGQLVHMSSIGAYAPGPALEVDENYAIEGVPSSPYSLDKVAAEQTVSALTTDVPVAVVRPAFVLQEAAASEIRRYFLGRLVPRGALGVALRPAVLARAPVPSTLALQVVHADDVADALARVVTERATGPFNVATGTPITRDTWRQTFGGVGPAVPAAWLRRAAGATWRLHLHETAPSWLDLAFDLPLLQSGRVRALGWAPDRDGPQVLADFLAAMRRGSGRPGPLLHRDEQGGRPGPSHGNAVNQ